MHLSISLKNNSSLCVCPLCEVLIRHKEIQQPLLSAERPLKLLYAPLSSPSLVLQVFHSLFAMAFFKSNAAFCRATASSCLSIVFRIAYIYQNI